jgi:hypothetical protein
MAFGKAWDWRIQVETPGEGSLFCNPEAGPFQAGEWAMP